MTGQKERKRLQCISDSLGELYSSFFNISSGRYGSQLRQIIGEIPVNATQTREVTLS